MVFWIVLCCGTLAMLLFFVITNFSNLGKLKRLEEIELPPAAGRISIIVPARNEERNIQRCVRSLLAQQGVHEVIVVDDNSTDLTPTILRRLAEGAASCGGPRLTVVSGKPLPGGWMGKNWACWQGYRASRGSVLLFTDADTWHAPDAAGRAAAALRGSGASLLSMIVHQETGSFGVKSLVPILFWLLYSLFPFALINEHQSLPLYFGNGQFMMFTRRAYRAIGGHKAIRNNVFDDMTLARRTRRHGMRVLIIDGSRHVSCRMYETLAEAFRGLCKNIYMLFRYTFPPRVAAPLYLLGLAGFAFTLFSPILSILIDLSLVVAGFPVSAPVIGLSVAGIVLSWLTLSIVYLRFRFPFVMVLLYPFTVSLFLLTALGSLVLTKLGRTQWKGRVLAHAMP